MDLTPFIQLIIGVITVVIARFAVPFIKARTTDQQRAIIAAAVETAVKAAEQIKELTTGKEKYEYVRNYLISKGFTLDFDETKALIEAAVYEVKNSFLLTTTNENAQEVDYGNKD